ncbi:ABC transporter ATP-binding protein [Ligilactobacillus ruminis]|uniref:ABC transporter ATP-binding protein n=1 Tax=Ligilactobacillus ruminis TaxID=1623 RepID=UPI003CFD53FB
MEIELSNVTKTIKKQEILRGINLKLQSGNIYGLRGKNGAGKSVLLKLICGIDTPTEGEIRIDGQVLGKDISFPKSVGALIESPSLIENQTAMGNLKSLGAIKKIATQEQMESLLQYFGLDPKDKKRVKKYSLGMRQKLGIIMALFENPELIILDEPLNALDEQSNQLLLELVKKYRADGSLIIVASHDREELDYLSDVVLELKDGKIRAGQTNES